MTRVAIVGAAESDLGAVAEGTTPVDLMAQASLRALEDCGIELGDVDGLFSATTQLNMPTLSLGEYLGVVPRHADGTQVGGSSFIAHLSHARTAIAAGACEVALIAYGSTQRLAGRAAAAPQEISPYEEPYEPWHPITGYALAASRHMHEFGTTREQLAAVAVTAREWAAMNPKAWRREPLTIEDVLGAPLVSDPFGLLDVCLLSDGGGALVVTSEERAGDLRQQPVYVLGVGESQSHRHVSSMPTLTTSAAVDSGRKAFEMAGLGPEDVDVVELYDAFTLLPILFLEDLGFCDKGDGGPYVAEGHGRPGGVLPMNTNGGGLSYCHPGMYGLLALVEAVRQIRGKCGDRQVDGCETALVHGTGAVLASHCTAILGAS